MARYYNDNSIFDYFTMPIHLCIFIVILFLVFTFSWYINYESRFEDMMSQVKIFLMLSPVILLLIVHCLSSTRYSNFFIPWPEQDSLDRDGGSPWGVALLLVFLIFMISYQSSIHERWFPLVSK